ncbi:OmpW/AlkL family protein [Allosphingosinicella sp.]|uniref:OmpW/AlkL family protein n=1 Tax=Allosphingosinicella sp. TaxID=2823234 RepID=UPI002EDA4DE8
MFRPLILAATLGSVLSATAAHAQTDAADTGYVHVGLARVDQKDEATLYAGGNPVPNAGYETQKKVTAAIEAGFFVYEGAAIAVGAVLPAETPNIASGSLDGLGNLGDEKPGFLTATAQYHFNRNGTVSPYVGAGISYLYFADLDDGVVTDLDIDNSWGTALQAGADIRVSGRWSLFVDAKKLFIDTNASGFLGGAPITADAEVDPWILSAGVGFRF